jgi:hypothetical protein
MITAKSLKKRFVTKKGQVVDALNDVSFEVRPGEFLSCSDPPVQARRRPYERWRGLKPLIPGCWK